MPLSDLEVQEALDICATEPVHIPGKVQPFACLISADQDTHRIKRVSENAEAFFGVKLPMLFDKDVREFLGREIWHAVNNAMGLKSLETASAILGNFDIGDGRFAVSVFKSHGEIAFEFEIATESRISADSTLQNISFFMSALEECTTEQGLFDASVELLKDFTGYDLVMVYRFDRDFNGEVLAEEREREMESFQGLRFPHWDIPAQARDMMRKLPIRIISDVDQRPVIFTELKLDEAPLDISLAACRGVSPVHMEYLRNMGTAATMTLSVMFGDVLWGIISFHHRTPRVPDPMLRQFSVHFGQLFSSKLQVIQQRDRLEMVARVDRIKEQALTDLESTEGSKVLTDLVMEVMDATGVHICQGSHVITAGTVPEEPLIEELQYRAKSGSDPIFFDSIVAEYPSLENTLNGCAGALAISSVPDQTLLVFRPEIASEVVWAGNPEKTIDTYEGRLRLSPRGAFSAYIEQTRGRSKPWSEQDVYFSTRLRALINSVERREMMSVLSRQQNVLIDELNHRVRNILALVRSVSQQARRSSYGSLHSYSRALEARIQALAASHDLASGSIVASISVKTMIEKEFAPYTDETRARAIVNGESKPIRAESAPIFALVIHELVTNAVKYGALSNDRGKVTIDLEDAPEGLTLHWKETGGPPVVPPKERGFGHSLIKQAIPHELDGISEIDFPESGVVARLSVPSIFFDLEAKGKLAIDPEQRHHVIPSPRTLFAPEMFCLVLEDNFVLAQGLRMQMKEFGVRDVKIMKSVPDAVNLVRTYPPDFAILDINLGPEQTSEPIAEQLADQGVPFVFLTGYGDSLSFKGKFDKVPRLTKPATSEDLLIALGQVLPALS